MANNNPNNRRYRLIDLSVVVVFGSVTKSTKSAYHTGDDIMFD
jgi:hypothetical protein